MIFVKNFWYNYNSAVNQYFVEDEHMLCKAYGKVRL